MKKCSIVIIVTGNDEALLGVKLHRNHPDSSVIIPTDIAAITYLISHNVSHIPLHTIITDRDVKNTDGNLPYKIITEFLSHPKIKSQLHINHIDLTIPLTEMLRFELSSILAKFYYLNSLLHQYQPSQIFASNKFFPISVVELVQSQRNLSWHNLQSSRSLINVAVNLFHHTINTWIIFLRHPKILLQILLHPPQKLLPRMLPNKPILIFSNGLNLASYSTAIIALNKKLPTTIVTGKQSLLDRFYLAKYDLHPVQIDPQQPDIIRMHNKLHRRLSFLISHYHPTRITFSASILSGLKLSSLKLNFLLHQTTSKILSTWLDKFLRFYAAADTLITTTMPKLVITTHDSGPTGVGFVLAARYHHVRSLVLIHGAPSNVHPTFSQAELVWGPLMKQQLVRAGIKASYLILGGNPIYAAYRKFFLTRSTTKTNILRLGIITSGFGDQETHQVKFFDELFRQLGRVVTPLKITIRTHPTQKLAHLSQFARLHNLSVTVNPAQLLEEFVRNQDIIITQDSTAAWVPLIAKKPTILIPIISPYFDNALFINLPAFITIKNWSQLPQVINSSLKPQALRKQQRIQEQYVCVYCGPLDENVGELMAKKILTWLR